MNEATLARANIIIMHAQHAKEHAHAADAKTCTRKSTAYTSERRVSEIYMAQERRAPRAREALGSIGSTIHGERMRAH